MRYRSSQPQRSHKFSTSACCPASLILPIITWIEVGGDLGVSDLQLESPVQRLYLSLVLGVTRKDYAYKKINFSKRDVLSYERQFREGD